MEERIGPALREARKARGITLRALAADTGVSASLLSQVENGKSQPSVSTLYVLVSRLGISLDDLLGLDVRETPAKEPSSGAAGPAGVSRPGFTLQRAADSPVLNMDSGVRWERLASFDDGMVEALLVTYPPGASSSAEGALMRHGGFEFAYLMEGSLTLTLEFDRYELGTGDSFCFDSTRPHLYVNHGCATARGLWYVIGPNTAEHTRERLSGLLSRIAAGRAPSPLDAGDAIRRLGVKGFVSGG
ncbi:helix-turn-helix domain-containing protein [Streptomyces solaniscabiei]|uniref:helix-turn-helix domain-containing protein n=1 Tax=Streptomyces solaniscabiei TaxID=2683255 RepID=UPI001CE272BB|nr:helix-turn-helix domain-containing protein [Streptomyces solaniscabiei]